MANAGRSPPPTIRASRPKGAPSRRRDLDLPAAYLTTSARLSRFAT